MTRRDALIVAAIVVGCLAWSVMALTRPLGLESHFDCGSVVSPEPVSTGEVAVMMESVGPATMSGPWEWRGVPSDWCDDARRTNMLASAAGVAAAVVLPIGFLWWRRWRRSR